MESKKNLARFVTLAPQEVEIELADYHEPARNTLHRILERGILLLFPPDKCNTEIEILNHGIYLSPHQMGAIENSKFSGRLKKLYALHVLS